MGLFVSDMAQKNKNQQAVLEYVTILASNTYFYLLGCISSKNIIFYNSLYLLFVTKGYWKGTGKQTWK